MKPFEQLKIQGQVRRMRALALAALANYELEIERIRLLGWFTNLLFRVDSVGGTSYVLRVCAPDWRTEIDLRSEVMWLKSLAQDEEIGAPVPQPTLSNEFILEVGAAGIPGTRRCLLMSWIPGIQLGKRLSEENLYKMGVLFARLHAQSAAFSPPAGFTNRKMSSPFARDEPQVLFNKDCKPFFNSHTRDIFGKTKKAVDRAFADLYASPDGLQVIHNDLWHDNIKLYRGRLRPLDFEDTIWGYPVQDIAMALQDLMEAVKPELFEQFQRAFRDGYISRRTWPEEHPGQIDTFRAGRMLWVANYVAHKQRAYLREHIERITPIFSSYLETGLIRKF